MCESDAGDSALAIRASDYLIEQYARDEI